MSETERKLLRYLHPSLGHQEPARAYSYKTNHIYCRQDAQHHGSNQSYFPYRIVAFLLMEGAFITLAAYATKRHILVPLSPSQLTVAKAIVTFISVIWHAVATFLIKDIALFIFSAEWMEVVGHYGKGVLTRQNTNIDIVSRITSGYIDQIKHLYSPATSSPFRLGFISTVLLLALSPLGPSAITVETIFLPYTMRVKVANLTSARPLFTFTNTSAFALWDDRIDRANIATRVELVDNSTYGFSTPDNNILIPWPDADLFSANTSVDYQTDVITFNYTCSWARNLRADLTREGYVWNIGNKSCILDGTSVQSWGNLLAKKGELSLCSRAVLPLYDVVNQPLSDLRKRPFNDVFNQPKSRFNVSSSDVKDSIWDRRTVPSSAFLFIGARDPPDPLLSNSSREAAINHPLVIEHTVPSIPLSQNLTGGVLSIWCNAMYSVSALVCEPHYEIIPATASTVHGTITLSEIHENQPPIGNIPMEVAQEIFAPSLSTAISSFQTVGNPLNSLTIGLFLTDRSKPINARRVTLPLNQINDNMNNAIRSWAKIYMSGFNPIASGGSGTPKYSTMDVDAVGRVEKLALGGSKPFLFVLATLVAVVAALFVVILVITREKTLRPFDLDNISAVLRTGCSNITT